MKLRKATEKDLNLISNKIKEINKHYQWIYCFFDSIVTKEINIEKVFSPRIIRSYIFSNETDWFIIYNADSIEAVILVAYPISITKTNSLQPKFLLVNKECGQKLPLEIIFECTVDVFPKILFKTENFGKLFLEKFTNAVLEAKITEVDIPEYYYSIMNHSVKGDLLTNEKLYS